jgi:putative colanic acid biosynthesis glycosyltransferase
VKLLQINSVVNTTGTGQIVENIGILALQNGWESYIAYGRKANPSKSKLIKIGSDVDIKLHGIKSRLLDRHGLGSHRATRQFIKQIEELNPDVIHLHNIHGYYLNIKILFEYLSVANIPIVWTLHDCWPLTGHCAYFDEIKCQKWKTGCFNCPQIKVYPTSYFIDRSKKNYFFKKELFRSINNMTIVTVSNWLKDIVDQSYLSHYPCQIIKNGIDTVTFSYCDSYKIRNKYNIAEKFVILGVANIWEARKGLSDFVQLSKLIDDNFVIVLVGLTQKQSKNLPSNIICIPRTDNKRELAELYSTADVFVNASIEESFGLTTVEALSCNTPAIVYDATACPETVNIMLLVYWMP